MITWCNSVPIGAYVRGVFCFNLIIEDNVLILPFNTYQFSRYPAAVASHSYKKLYNFLIFVTITMIITNPKIYKKAWFTRFILTMSLFNGRNFLLQIVCLFFEDNIFISWSPFFFFFFYTLIPFVLKLN